MVDQYFRKIEVFRPVSVAKGTGYFSKQSAVPKE
jgi:hypothetical protein